MPLTTNAKQRVALVSIAASGGLAAAKFAVGLATGSLAILSEAVHSTIDCGATIVTFWAVRTGDRPADENHPYGHGKFESLAALGETALLFVAAGWIGLEAVSRLWAGSAPVEVGWTAIAVLVVSIVVDFWRARALSRVAKETRSPALEADALHFSSDMLSSMVVLAGLGFVALGLPWADAAAALCVALFIAFAGWRLGRKTVDVLVDAAPAGASIEIARAVGEVPGVVCVDQVRARPLGGAFHVETCVGLSRMLSGEAALQVRGAVERAVEAVSPGAEVLVTTRPVALDTETALERVRVIAAERGFAVHHVTVQTLHDQLSVGLDLEVDGRMDLESAHGLATSLEGAIRAELGPDAEVETHIEPVALDAESGHAVDEHRRLAICEALRRHARESLVGNLHDVRARDTADGLAVIFHANAAPSVTVREVHDAIDELERRLRLDFPEIARVVGHAEPHGSEARAETPVAVARPSP